MISYSGNTEAATKAEEVYETNKSFQGSCRLQNQDIQRTQQHCCLPKTYKELSDTAVCQKGSIQKGNQEKSCL